MSRGRIRTERRTRTAPIFSVATRRRTVLGETLRIEAASATVRSGPTWRPLKIEAKDRLSLDREQRSSLSSTPSLSRRRFEFARPVPVVARPVSCAAEAALARAQAGILSDRYCGLVFSTEGSESSSPASRARSTDGRDAPSTGPRPGRFVFAFPEADEREGRIRPVYGEKEAHADPKTGAKKRKVLGLSLGGRKRRPCTLRVSGK
jgi:hypothetical protein